MKYLIQINSLLNQCHYFIFQWSLNQINFSLQSHLYLCITLLLILSFLLHRMKLIQVTLKFLLLCLNLPSLPSLRPLLLLQNLLCYILLLSLILLSQFFLNLINPNSFITHSFFNIYWFSLWFSFWIFTTSFLL